MRRAIWIGLGTATALAAALVAAPGKASGDYSCTQDWRLIGPISQAALGSMDCGNRPILWPGNDTRANMFLLQRRGQGLPTKPGAYVKGEWEDRSFGRSFFSWPGIAGTYGLNLDANNAQEGSRCDSLSGGQSAFIAALAAAKTLPAAEREALTKTRDTIAASCIKSQTAPVWPKMATAPGHAFLAYLQGADSFYAGDWDTARKTFAGLHKAADPWVAETALYMAIRVELNAAQVNAFDDYGTFKGTADHAAAARASAAIDAYLKRYPNGQYADSAKGLKRRALWLGGDMAALARQYETSLADMPLGSQAGASLIQEVDNKLLWAKDGADAIHTPLLLAAFDLERMRNVSEGPEKPLSATELDAQKSAFAGQPELFAYLTAARALYVDNDAKAVLTLVPAAAPGRPLTPLAYSMQGLRGVALATLHDPAEEAHWRALIAAADAPYTREFAELGLALVWQRAGHVGQVFAAGSPIKDATIRQILLSRIAGPDLLRAAIADAAAPARTRDVALFTLLAKDLSQGQYAAFARDAKLTPATAATKGYPSSTFYSDDTPTGLFTAGKWQNQSGYACPALTVTAAALATRADDPHGRLCLGEFWRLNGFDGMSDLDPLKDADTLGAGPGLFPGKPITRASLYAGVLASPRASADDKAYALYRSVMCYAPSGNNDCGGEEVPKETRKGWFYRLKGRYPNSQWAQELRYFW